MTKTPGRFSSRTLPLAAMAAAVAFTSVTSADTVRVWGSSPVRCEMPPLDARSIVELELGNQFVLARDGSGGLFCWGSGAGAVLEVPADVGVAVQIAAGAGHALALRDDGSVVAWGENHWGQCNVPAALRGVVQVSAGEAFSVALTGVGAVQCWGVNSEGQCSVPTNIGVVRGIDAGRHSVAAVRNDGSVVCWGLSGSGIEPPVDLGPVVSVACSDSNFYALLPDGSVRGWGNSLYGFPPAMPPLRVLKGGDWNFFLGLDYEGRMHAWGDNFFGGPEIPRDLGRARMIAGGTSRVGAAIQIGPACPADLDGSGAVDGGDIGILLSEWGHWGDEDGSISRFSDFDCSYTVDGADLSLLLGSWGACEVEVPSWATLIEAHPDPAVVTDPALRAAIDATGLAWRVRDSGTQIEMLLIPPGTFQMGCIMGSNAYGCYSPELPVHQVTLTNAFYLGRYEVTQAQWQATMGSNPSNWQGKSDSASRPVEKVSWNTIQGYLSATSMRLPTEAEWEYACRAGTQTPFYNGSTDDSTVGTLAWYLWNAEWQTHAVGGKAANGFGLHDMLGNVCEWVNDWYGTYPSSAQTDPTGPVNGLYRVFRGGAWFFDSGPTNSSSRIQEEPGWFDGYVGFRVARTP